MTTLPLVSAGGAAPALPEPAAQLDTNPMPGDALAVAPDADAGADALARFTASHEMHPLAQQQFAYAAPGGAGGVGNTKAPAPKVVPDAATRTYDVGNTSQADIDALKNSPDKQQQRLGHTIENAKASYGDLLAKGAKIVVTMNAGNGGEPTMTLMGPGFDANKQVRVHTHYHGDNATVGDPVGSKAGQASRIRETVARDPQMVFILPECKNASPKPDSPTHNGDYKADWGNVKSQAKTTDLALEAAGISKTKIEQETVSVHSRGGNVIANLMTLDKTGNSLRADRLELHDSLYGSESAVASWGRTANGKQVEKVIYVHGTNDAGRDRVIAKTFKGAYIRIDIARQKPLNDQNNPVVYDGKDAARHDHVKGEKNPHATRQYDTDPHYQTTGRFLAIWPLPN